MDYEEECKGYQDHFAGHRSTAPRGLSTDLSIITTRTLAPVVPSKWIQERAFWEGT